MISNIDHPETFPFHTLSAPTSTEYPRLNRRELIIPKILVSNNSSFRKCTFFQVLCLLLYTFYANSTVNIAPLTPLRCRDSDASQ
ncbi:hypothetical protein ACN42_g2004 [Penicillium freii]|uniref:Uncharacterized protein n=1 Tax=Penicillium freii TaxID=48697 RepID=A0A124GSP6_PENFR|nr:hypothetical protein ACN42_g2004 [Penicillium freii]